LPSSVKPSVSSPVATGRFSPFGPGGIERNLV
jgi:hypothetical protein